MKRFSTRTAAGAFSVAIAVASLGAQGAMAQSDSGSGYDIGFLPRAVNIPYFEAAFAGAQEAAGELGDTVTEVGPSEVTAAAQVPFIQTLTTQGVDGILLSSNDPDALLPALNAAASEGVVTVTFDSDTAPAGRLVYVNSATSDSIGRGEVQVISELIDSSGQIAVIASSATSPNETAWIEGMRAELAEPGYENVELVEVAYGQDEQASFDTATALMQRYPDLAGIIGTNSFALSATARAVQTAGRTGEVMVTGLGTPNDMRQYVKDGVVPKFILWSPKDLGYLGMYALHRAIAGEITGAEGETFEGGRLGEYTIGTDGEVILGPPTIFDASNIDDFDF